MRRVAAILLLAVACGRSEPAEHYGFVALLGRDTISVESVTRSGNTLTSDEVDRFPRVRQRHTQITLAPNGGVQHLDMEITTPSEPANERLRHVIADVTADSVIMTKRDKEAFKRWAYADHGAIVVAHVPQMYSLYELYFAAGLRHLAAAPVAGDTVGLRQFYPDREFDRFPLHHATVHALGGGKAEVWHDWLSGVGEATVDSAYRMLHYSGARTTYKVEVTRLDQPPDVAAIGARFAAAEAAQGGVRQLSPRDTVRATLGEDTLRVDYSRPLARGRELLGKLLPYGQVWRTGANAATQFTTTAPITVAGKSVPAGTYTLWTLPTADGATLIINSQFGQWGTEYNAQRDFARVPLQTAKTDSSVERFTISIPTVDEHRATLVMEWGPFRWSVPIVSGVARPQAGR